MKTAQELRVGNVVMIGKDPMVVQRAEFSANAPGRLCVGIAVERAHRTLNEIGVNVLNAIRIRLVIQPVIPAAGSQGEGQRLGLTKLHLVLQRQQALGRRIDAREKCTEN